MTEKLLQFIWQFQYFNDKELKTTDGEALQIICRGEFNHHQGPDFLNGRIKAGSNVWAGNIELHVHASDWHRHLHGADTNYENVMLHVVWKDDNKKNDSRIPVLVLEDRVPKLLIQQYESWLKNEHFIPCESSMQVVDEFIWTFWKERLLVERLQRKSGMILEYLEKNNFHWEETLWWMIAGNFGLVVNADAFTGMAMSIPYNVLLKHHQQIHQLEALLLGQAGLLENKFQDKYPRMLQKEYSFLRNKYNLEPVAEPVHFLRMRPACFPTVRLAQLAMLLNGTSQLFATILSVNEADAIRNLLNVTANDYWHYHFTFGAAAGFRPKKLGDQMINIIMANSIIPVLYTYGKYRGEERYINKALDWMHGLTAEKNSLTAKFGRMGIPVRTAADSQSLKELKSQYCDQRRCLECAVGNAILKRQTAGSRRETADGKSINVNL